MPGLWINKFIAFGEFCLWFWWLCAIYGCYTIFELSRFTILGVMFPVVYHLGRTCCLEMLSWQFWKRVGRVRLLSFKTVSALLGANLELSAVRIPVVFKVVIDDLPREGLLRIVYACFLLNLTLMNCSYWSLLLRWSSTRSSIRDLRLWICLTSLFSPYSGGSKSFIISSSFYFF